MGYNTLADEKSEEWEHPHNLFRLLQSDLEGIWERVD
jgi:hypothetical protein